MRCPHCDQEHPQGIKFCPVTGKAIPEQREPAPLPLLCPSCGFHLPKPGLRFCPSCGFELTRAAPPPAAQSPVVPPQVMLRPRLSPWVVFGMLLLAAAVIGVIAWQAGLFAGKPAATAAPTLSAEQPGQGEGAPGVVAENPASQPAPTRTPRLQPTAAPTRKPTATPAPTRTPQPSATAVAAGPTPLGGSGGLIAFTSDRSGNNDIYVMDTAGGNVTQLTFEPIDQRIPSWSPDGKRLAFQSKTGSDYEIVILELETLSQRAVTSNSCDDYAPIWSPDGRQFAFYSDCDGNREVYRMNIDGSNRQQLTRTSTIYNWFPTWSPDGKLLTYSSNQTGKYYIYVLDLASGGVSQVARGCVSSFSPDGGKLLFTSYCSDSGEVWLARADGSNVRKLPVGDSNNNPAWSPDGRWVLYQSEASGNFEIYLLDMDSEQIVQLIDHSAKDASPVWQPALKP